MAEEKQILTYNEMVLKLSDIVSGKLTGTFSLATTENHFATISLKNGRVVGATYRQLKGGPAIEKITQINGGRCNFSEGALRSDEVDETLPSTEEIFKALGVPTADSPEESIEESEFETDAVMALIEKEAVEYLGPMAAMICRENLDQVGHITSQADLFQLINGIAGEVGDTSKETEFKNKILEKLNSELSG